MCVGVHVPTDPFSAPQAVVHLCECVCSTLKRSKHRLCVCLCVRVCLLTCVFSAKMARPGQPAGCAPLPKAVTGPVFAPPGAEHLGVAPLHNFLLQIVGS